MPPPGLGDTMLPQMPPPMWDHPKLFAGAQEQLLHPMFQQLPPLPPNVVPGPMFFGQPCIQDHGPMPRMWQPVPYDFKYWDKKPNIGQWEGAGPFGKNGQVNSWWNPIGVWGSKGQVIGTDDWNFPKQWGNPGYVPNNNVVLKVSNGGGVPNPPKQPNVEVKTPVQPPVQPPVKTPVKPVVLPPVQPPLQPTQPPINPVPEVKVVSKRERERERKSNVSIVQSFFPPITSKPYVSDHLL